MNEKYEINELPLGALVPFKNHPFKVIENEELTALAQSIQESGVLVPALARPAGDRYELISGHRRLAACKLLGLSTIPVIVRDLTDAEAIITMVDANLQREHILPSEKAFAYKMKMEAMKHQGQASRQVGTMSRTDQQIAKESKDSARQIQRYIRLTNLIPEILDMVDKKEIALTPAVELSYLTQWEQRCLYNIMQMDGATPSLSQAQRMRRMSEERRLGEGDMEDIMAEIKGNQVECIRITEERFRKHFRRDVSPLEMAEIIDKALEYEPIIDREVFEQVQDLIAKTKRRSLKKKGEEKHLFSGMLYCADCGSKLWYRTNTINNDIHFYSCCNYKTDTRGTCETRHYIRADAIEEVVRLELRRLASFLQEDEEAFVTLLARKTQEDLKQEKKMLETELQRCLARKEKVSLLYENLYEYSVSGKISEESFMEMSHKYELEKMELKTKISDIQARLSNMGSMEKNHGHFLAAIRRFMEMDKLTAPLLRELIDHITVYETEGTGKNRSQRVMIHYRFIGILEYPHTEPAYTADTRKGVAVKYLTQSA